MVFPSAKLKAARQATGAAARRAARRHAVRRDRRQRDRASSVYPRHGRLVARVRRDPRGGQTRRRRARPDRRHRDRELAAARRRAVRDDAGRAAARDPAHRRAEQARDRGRARAAPCAPARGASSATAAASAPTGRSPSCGGSRRRCWAPSTSSPSPRRWRPTSARSCSTRWRAGPATSRCACGRPQGSDVAFVKQVAPAIEDLTARAVRVDALTADYPTGAWGGEARDYHVCIRVRAREVGDEVLAGRLLARRRRRGGQPGADSRRLDRRRAALDPHQPRGRALHRPGRAGGGDPGRASQARKAGDEATATFKLGRAVRLAARGRQRRRR